MAVYLYRGALRLPAGSLLANSRLCVNLAFEIWLLLGVNVATTYDILNANVNNIVWRVFAIKRWTLVIDKCLFSIKQSLSHLIMCGGGLL